MISLLTNIGAITLSSPLIVIDDSSLKNATESFTVALTLTLGGYESATAPKYLRKTHLNFDFKLSSKFLVTMVKCTILFSRVCKVRKVCC